MVTFLARRARRGPLILFLAWFFTVGQLLAFTPRVVGRLSGVEPPTEPFIIASTALGLLLPVAALTWAADGRAGLRTLFADTVRWRVHPGWYVLALVVVPVAVVGVQIAAAGNPSVTPGQAAVDLVTHFLAPTLVVLVTVNLAEEVAWTGFVQHRLQVRHGSHLRAAAAVAPVFALGHVSLVTGGLGEVAGFMVLLSVLTFPFRVLQGWLFERTRSLLVVGLVHAAGNAAALGSLGIEGLVPAWYGAGGQSLIVFAAIGIVVTAALTLPRHRGTTRFPVVQQVPNADATPVGHRRPMDLTRTPAALDPTGLRAFRPLATFVSIALPVGWLLLTIPLVLDIPVEPFILATTLFGLVLPAVMLTRREGAGAGRLLRDTLRMPRPLWLLVPAALLVPVGTAAAAALLDVSAPLTASLLGNLALANVLSGLLIVNLWEEMVWAGFVQRRAMGRWGYAAGSVVTALLFTGIHLPLSLYGADGVRDVGANVAAMVVAGIGMRLLIGAFDLWGRGSILTLALIHATFNASSELVAAGADWVRYTVMLGLGLSALAIVNAGRRTGTPDTSDPADPRSSMAGSR
jgi:membrane protease YdiL (CAAX protease family)